MGSYYLLILHRQYPCEDSSYHLHMFPGYPCYQPAYGNIKGIARNVLSQSAEHFLPISFRIDLGDRRKGNHLASLQEDHGEGLETPKALDHQHLTSWHIDL